MIRAIFRFRREWVLVVVLAAIMFVMTRMTTDPESGVSYFLDANNLLDLSRHLAEVGIIACGMTLIIMTGGIDLSVGSILGLTSIVLGYTWNRLGIWGGAFTAVGVGVFCGMFNGALVTKWKLPPLVVTLATMALFRGAATVISKAQPVSDFPDGFDILGQGVMGDLFGVAEPAGFGIIPVQLVIWIVLVLITIVIAHWTPVGRYTMAIGDNERAALFAALPVRKLTFWIYTCTGLLSGFAGVLFTSKMSTSKSDAGAGLELEVITAVVLGGTAITGGRGTVIGTFLGVVILGFLRNGLTLAGVESVWRELLAGVLLIVTAVLNQRLIERAARRKTKAPVIEKASAATA